MTERFLVSDDPGRPVADDIAPDDGMFDAHAPPAEARGHYLACGRSALRAVRLALAAAGRADVRRVLDFPCGHGRVLRALAAAFPAAELHACDLLAAGVAYCHRRLGAVPLGSDPDPARVRLPGGYDLIWVGSLFTHLDAPRWPGFLRLFHAALAPGGVCVVTTHGRRAADLIRGGRAGYGLPDPGGLLAPFADSGFGYTTYQAGSDYGVSLSSAGWVAGQLAALPAARLLLALEHGWADHQDVYAWQKG